MAKNVLISGGTGLVGSRLTEMLLEKGYQVSMLSRGKASVPNVTVYQWDVTKKQIETQAVTQADYIIHLAGAGIADERWTEARKKVILDSRTESARLLSDTLKATGHQPKAFLSASAIGIYGADRGEESLSETSTYGNDFLAYVTKAWEATILPITELGIRTVLMRIGIVLSEKGGALKKIAAPIRLGAGAPLGSGHQWMSWIHVDDLCQMFIYAMENESLQGSYNAVAPHPATNKQLTQTTALALHRPLILPNVPAFALKLAFGELSIAVLGSLKVENKKIASTGFTYTYPTLPQAIENLMSK